METEISPSVNIFTFYERIKKIKDVLVGLCSAAFLQKRPLLLHFISKMEGKSTHFYINMTFLSNSCNSARALQ